MEAALESLEEKLDDAKTQLKRQETKGKEKLGFAKARHDAMQTDLKNKLKESETDLKALVEEAKVKV
jgi:uncharacterized protein involved in type VI secretion and phage assembly